MIALSHVLLALGLLGLGRFVLGLAGRGEERDAEAAGTALVAGLVVAMLALYAALAISGRVVYPVFSGLAVLGYLPLLRDLRRGRLGRDALPSFALPLLAATAFLAIASVDAPFAGYDAKAIYGVKAKVLLHDGDLEGPLFQDPDVVHYHGDYPLGVPLLLAAGAQWAGGAPEFEGGGGAAPNVASWLGRHDGVDRGMPLAGLWIVALVWIAAGRVQRLRRGGVVSFGLHLLSIPVVVAVPWLGGGSWSLAGADLPLAACLGAAGFAAFDFASGRRAHGPRALLVPALLAAGALCIKSDALLALAPLAVALVVAARPVPRSAVAAAAVAGGTALGLVLWRVVAAETVGAPFDEDYVAAIRSAEPAAVLGRVGPFLGATWDVLEERHMGIWWIAALLVGLPLGLRRAADRGLALWAAMFLAGVCVVFLVTPNQITWHVTTALPRLWCQLALPVGALVAAAAGELFAPGAESEPSAQSSSPADALAAAPGTAAGSR